MKKKAFTLIELLAVIIILAIVTIIATPVVLDVIEDSRKSADRTSAHMVLSAANNYYAESLFDKDKKNQMDGNTNVFEMLAMTNKPDKGSVYINEQGQVALSLVMNKTCYVKTYNGLIEEYDENSKECKIETILDDVMPSVTITPTGGQLSNEWYIESPYYEVKVTDEVSGFSSYKWCSGYDCEPTTVEYTNETSKIIGLDSSNTQICAIGIDKAGNVSEKVCSEPIKLDTQAPEFEGIMGDKTIGLNEEIDLITGVSVTDATSGINGTFKILNDKNEEISSLDTSKAGTYEINYIAYDIANNEGKTTIYITVSGDAPVITFIPEEGAINELGWAKEEFYVDINIKDNSGHGIKEVSICTSNETDRCEPNNTILYEELGSRLIATESNNNRICVQATDNFGTSSGVTCSEAYKLDKTNPTSGTIKVNESSDIKQWYTEDVTIELINGEDELSGHLSTTSNITSITENTSGTTVIVTTKDKAGNETTKEYTIRLDKTLPSITIEEPSINGENGWYKEIKPTIKITASDTISTFNKLKWCLGIDCNPTEEVSSSTKEITIEDTKGTQICVIAYDKALNESGKVCSNTIKVDTEKPEITGIKDITIGLNGTFDLETGVEVIDTTSGIKETIIPKKDTINVSKAGTYPVTYKAIDKAGNEKTITRNVIVATNAPDITFTPTANEKGWSKEDFTVTINAKDNSGHGIKQMYICTATTDRCNPTEGSLITGTSATRDIVIESNNNRICVQAEDNYNQTSEVICSDAYKLDKTLPTVSYSLLGGTYGEHKTIRITPSDSNYSKMHVDVYKGGMASENYVPEKSKYNITDLYYDVELDSNDIWYVFTRVYDKAGNKQEQTPNNGTGENGWYYQTYTIDTNQPTVTINKTVSNNQNVLTATINPSTSVSGYSYQWYKNGSPISGATNINYTTSNAGTYKVVVTTGAGKTVTSNEMTINSYTVSYNLNGGTGSIGSTTKIQDLSTNTTTSVPTRSGYTFMGWGSSASDTSVDYASNVPYTLNENKTLYAIWKKTVIVTFSGNGASLSKTSATCDMYNADSSCTVTAPKITREGFTITGFNTSSSATTSQVTSEGSVAVSANTTYYAITSKEVTVTFYRNGAASITPSGGSASTATSITQTCTIQNSATTCNLTSPSITASSNTPTVLGWNTSSGSTSSAWNVDTAKAFSSNASYYAITRKDAVTRSITYAKGTGVSAIGTTSGTCTIAATYNGTAQSGSCNVTLPSITASTGYTASGWYNSSNTKLGNASASIAVSANQTITAKATANSYTCSSGYYLGASSTSCTKCEAGSWCPGGTYTFTSSVQGKNSCPSIYTSSATGSDSNLDCYLTTQLGKYIASSTASTQTTCPAGYYCPGATVYYGNTGGSSICPSGYGTSAAGSTAASNCYLTTTAGKYIATANSATQTACQSGYYCPATTVYYGQTGGRSTCPSGYGTSAAGSDASSDCYKTITVSYAGNGATGGSTENSSCNAYYNNGSCSITLRTNGFTKTNYDFQGWGTSTSSVSHNAGTSYSFSTNTTLNAIWTSSAICRRATTLHTETCMNSSTGYCSAYGYSYGSTITYGSLGTSGVLTSGDAFDCDVNGDGIYDSTTERFYYVSNLYDTKTKSFNSDYAVLIYYNNTKNGVTSIEGTSKYASNNNLNGPTTAITNLPTTSQWSNVSLSDTVKPILDEVGNNMVASGTSSSGGTLSSYLTTSFSYSGYAARLLRYQEVATACGTNVLYQAGSLKGFEYLLENTKYSNYSIGTYGYWLETPADTYVNGAWFSYSVNASFSKVSATSSYGVRPVIEVKKTDISY